jgi:hypothetical protein
MTDLALVCRCNIPWSLRPTGYPNGVEPRIEIDHELRPDPDEIVSEIPVCKHCDSTSLRNNGSYTSKRWNETRQRGASRHLQWPAAGCDDHFHRHLRETDWQVESRRVASLGAVSFAPLAGVEKNPRLRFTTRTLGTLRVLYLCTIVE